MKIVIPRRAAPLYLTGCAAIALGLIMPVSMAWSQTPGSGLAASYSKNSDKPIDIVADSLEVDDGKKIAVFKGNVSATQGDFNLRAKEIQVLYTSGDDKAPKAEAASSVPGGGNANITQIDAKGKVLITTKGDQTATSDWAIFEVKKQQVTIGGDVRLSQGKNLIRGSRLVIDLTTGLSRFETPKTSDAGDKGSRGVRMIFTPKSRDGKK